MNSVNERLAVNYLPKLVNYSTTNANFYKLAVVDVFHVEKTRQRVSIVVVAIAKQHQVFIGTRRNNSLFYLVE